MRKIIFVAIFLSIWFCSCASSGAKKISVMNWNLETFFDAQIDGTEYKEFSGGKSSWTKEKYEVRLDRLASVIKTLNCDVLVLEELEKSAQIRDIQNRLSSAFRRSRYRHAYFACEKGAPIGSAILSRYPISSATVHSIGIFKAGLKQPSLRPIMRVVLNVDGRDLVLFVNHWKSKAGGAEKSEIWRDGQEELLSRLVQKDVSAGLPVVACGDFNRSIEEFSYQKGENSNVVLKGGATVYSPWYSDDGKLCGVGSYWYKNEWERIDHFFLAGDARVVSFAPQTNGEWIDKNGHPKKYRVYSGSGYSDHLPLKCEISF